MKNILDYQDYRAYISDYYSDRKAKSAFSWREFAGISRCKWNVQGGRFLCEEPLLIYRD